MKPINIYGLTRAWDDKAWRQPERLERLERQMSGRQKYMKIKSWEMDSLTSLCAHLAQYVQDISKLEFYYSFVLPKLGKEFDLLRIGRNSVLNIELKSGEVSDEDIRKQLALNNYYLSMLNRTNYFFTYISSTDRLVRMSHAGRILEADWETLVEVLMEQTDCFSGDIEELFRENEYLISPLTDTGRFLRREYFLTSQQRDIKKNILREIRGSRGRRGKEKPVRVGFTGLPGTGKTLLLYDLAMELSENEKVCIFHFGAHAMELEKLDKRLKRVDFCYCRQGAPVSISDDYAALFIDEAHRIDPSTLETITSYAGTKSVPVIISYDSEEPIALAEQKKSSMDLIESIPGFVKYRLTNRIRLNRELSSFIACVMNISHKRQRRQYPAVSILFAGNTGEVGRLKDCYIKKGYTYIRDALVDRNSPEERERPEADRENDPKENEGIADVREATNREFDKVLMLLDASFYYDEEGYLRSAAAGDGRVRHFYHGLNRAKKNIAIIVLENREIFDRILGVLQ